MSKHGTLDDLQSPRLRPDKGQMLKRMFSYCSVSPKNFDLGVRVLSVHAHVGHSGKLREGITASKRNDQFALEGGSFLFC